ncbi:KN motif and ankyrin repeat domain-containing protein 2 isoform X2 [Perognathus longimembris pacificus]|uniref:KN motif and ankyrin repeat domain-containing protein 2 isoform X2 n=1 Tax=Perognathus longimembris pacificus TaxID=214514 RepID=UPI002018A23F|nr:KN motif and ankyrin repeat domain-containing protein 2 isoform X2 [Perognathus longimembris pacificus]
MAQVLHVPAPFPGTPGPTPPPFQAREAEPPPYSVETPYGYRLDLDFLKYVDDIEKGHTLRRVAVQRRPRLGSLPRGAGSWWTSTESLCSTASADSRHSAFSSCGRSGPSAGVNPRVERTLLDARRRLEAQVGPGLAGSAGSLAGSTGSLATPALPPATPRGSGLSTPVAPSAGHLAHVREQMAAALRKLRQLEEQVKLIPVLQVKLSVLQEEKRQLAVQLRSRRFLGPPTAADDTGLAARSVGTWVRERDLGLPDGEAALAAKVAVLETQLHRALQELRAAQARQPRAPGSPGRVDTVRVVHGPREVEVAASTAAGAPAQRAQDLEPHGAGLRALAATGPESPAVFCSHEVLEAPSPAPAAAPTGHVHAIKKISITERSCDPAAGLAQTSAESPVSPPESAVYSDTSSCKPAQHAAPSPEPQEASGAGGDSVAVESIAELKEAAPDPAVQRRSLQFVEVNGGYESSSEDSSTAENFSDNDSTENEAPEPEVRVPSEAEAPQQTPAGAAVVRTGRPPCQLSRESQHVPSAEGAAGSNSEEEIRMELSPDLISACLALEKYLDNANALTERELKVAYTTVLQEWLRLACRSDAHPELVRRHLVTFRAMSTRLLDYVVNIADGNGNTALHYSVSHANFPVVRQLLDSGVCKVDKQNRAGYSPIMLTALATLKTQDDIQTVDQLFRLGDVNAKASQAGQTALMLAVSHGRVDVVKALLACGADVNAQDDDGSTALMCACEHGFKEITGLLLAVPGCNTALTDRVSPRGVLPPPPLARPTARCPPSGNGAGHSPCPS